VEIFRGKFIEMEREILRGKKLRGNWIAFDVSRFNGILKSKTQLLTAVLQNRSSIAKGKYIFLNFVSNWWKLKRFISRNFSKAARR